MKIINGDGGGLIFRADTANTLPGYVFYVTRDGSYSLTTCTDNTNSSCDQPLIRRFSSAINIGLIQTNVLDVVAQGTSIMLFVNHKQIYSLNDSTSATGQIGVIAYAPNTSTEVAYSNAKVWAL